jgi:hypothetical protein
MIAYVSNDNVVRLSGASAILVSTGATTFLTSGATVTFRLQTLDLVDVAGETWPVTMSYIAGSDGDFIGVLRESVSLTPDQEYYFVGVVDNGADQRGSWRLLLRAQRREV